MPRKPRRKRPKRKPCGFGNFKIPKNTVIHFPSMIQEMGEVQKVPVRVPPEEA